MRKQTLKGFVDQIFAYLVKKKKTGLVQIDKYDDYKTYLIIKFVGEIGKEN